jgi:hypothetical protein
MPITRPPPLRSPAHQHRHHAHDLEYGLTKLSHMALRRGDLCRTDSRNGVEEAIATLPFRGQAWQRRSTTERIANPVVSRREQRTRSTLMGTLR